MSKIAEKKVMELGYGIDPLSRNEYSANDVFDAAVECYDQAMQDFMEKAEGAVSMISRHYVGEDYTFDQIWERFKNYMQDEM